MKSKDDIVVFRGNANPKLAMSIAERMGISLASSTVKHFPDGEIDIKVDQHVRGTEVYVIQPTCPPVNENLMELLLLVDTLKRASASRVTAVIPYYGYARKDRKDEGRVPISAKLVANMLTAAGTDRILTIDLHAPQIQGFFDIPIDHLYASKVLIPYFKKKNLENVVVVSPDVGGLKLARAYARSLEAKLAIVDKDRISPESTIAERVIGDVEGMTVVLVDDMISTGGSIREAARVLKSHGARDIYVGASHGILCGPAVDNLQSAPVEEVVVTDTVPIEGDKRFEGLVIRSVAGILADAIARIHESRSISEMFEET